MLKMRSLACSSTIADGKSPPVAEKPQLSEKARRIPFGIALVRAPALPASEVGNGRPPLKWVNRAALGLRQPLAVYPHQRTSSAGWSGWRRKRRSREPQMQHSQAAKQLRRRTNDDGKQPDGQIRKTCPAPPTKIFRLTRRANHHYKLAPSHPNEGRCATS